MTEVRQLTGKLDQYMGAGPGSGPIEAAAAHVVEHQFHLGWADFPQVRVEVDADCGRGKQALIVLSARERSALFRPSGFSFD